MRRTHTQRDGRRATQYLLRSLSDGEDNHQNCAPDLSSSGNEFQTVGPARNNELVSEAWWRSGDIVETTALIGIRHTR